MRYINLKYKDLKKGQIIKLKTNVYCSGRMCEVQRIEEDYSIKGFVRYNCFFKIIGAYESLSVDDEDIIDA